MDLTSVINDKEIYLSNFVDNLKVFNKVMLWGLSESADAAIDFFRDNNINITGIYDDDKSKNGTSYRDISIFNPGDEVFESDRALVITCSYYESIRKSLIDKDPNIDDRLFMFDGYFLEDNIYYIEQKSNDNDNNIIIGSKVSTSSKRPKNDPKIININTTIEIRIFLFVLFPLPSSQVHQLQIQDLPALLYALRILYRLYIYPNILSGHLYSQNKTLVHNTSCLVYSIKSLEKSR